MTIFFPSFPLCFSRKPYIIYYKKKYQTEYILLKRKNNKNFQISLSKVDKPNIQNQTTGHHSTNSDCQITPLILAKTFKEFVNAKVDFMEFKQKKKKKNFQYKKLHSFNEN